MDVTAEDPALDAVADNNAVSSDGPAEDAAPDETSEPAGETVEPEVTQGNDGEPEIASEYCQI